ncbi:DnaJ domain-containing protein [Caviibacter abscessus]|uniref:DnaJ domain-containing protein n=1 Tax=Caviibacter abscessus TaxID=1766719 RepID=UPI000834CB2A|nr:DnaJ domain-containing protein [Caviibacter abscessus]
MLIIFYILALMVGIMSLFLLLPYWVYFLIAAITLFTKGQINYLVVICVILGILKLVNKNKGPKFNFKRTYYYDNSDFFNQFKYRSNYDKQYYNTFENIKTESEYEKACVILGVSPNSSMEEKKKRYLQLLKKYHPDINHTDEAVEKTKEINDAWDIIQKYQGQQ